MDDYEDYGGFDVDLINDLATGSDSSPVVESLVGVASPSGWQVVHSDIQSLHWSVLCIYVVCFFCWVCKQWG